MSEDLRQCYYPAGNKAGGTYPCTSDETTHCCGRNNICLTNGYCLDVSQPYVLSRGGCTSKNWGSGCPTHCQDISKTKGSSIINLKYTNGTASYCCGTPTIENDEIVCPSGKSSFEIDDGEVISGHAGLVNLTTITGSTNSSCNSTSSGSTIDSTSATSASSSGSHDVALGAGLGVPLGIIALGSLVWAFMERRRANKLSKAVADSTAPATGFFGHPHHPNTPVKTVSSSGPSELDTARRMPELEARDKAAA